MPLRNVLVFALGTARYAVELRWVREVVGITAVTPVPTAPPAIAGIINFRGTIVPLIAAPFSLRPHPPPDKMRAPRNGDQAILLDAEGVRAAIAADRIDEVTTLVEAQGGTSGALVDPRGRTLPLVDPTAIFTELRERVGEAAARLAVRLAGERSAVS
jgi:purine-binding chemotaxis protein CheW